MKKFYLVALGCVLLSSVLHANPFQAAEEQYRQGHFAAALASYEDLLQTYPKDPYLYYNIGNCYFKMGSKGLAVANYYRAWRLSARDSDIRHNLNLALQQSGEKLVPSGMPEIFHKAFFWLTETELKGLFFLTLWLMCLSTSYWLVTKRGGILALSVWLLLAVTGIWYLWQHQFNKEPLAVIAIPVAELRSGPGNTFPASANVAQGHLVSVQDSRENWREVVVKSQGIKGWIEAPSLEQI